MEYNNNNNNNPYPENLIKDLRYPLSYILIHVKDCCVMHLRERPDLNPPKSHRRARITVPQRSLIKCEFSSRSEVYILKLLRIF